MKRALLCALVVGGAAVLQGCPIYSNQSDFRVCTATACYDCPDPSYSSMCVTWSCGSDTDCPGTFTCSVYGQCVPTSSGDDASVPNDCSLSGCPSGEICLLSGGVASCVPLDGSTADGSPTSDGTTSSDGSPAEGGSPTEAGADAPAPYDAPG